TTITVSVLPTTAYAGNDQNLCNVTATTLAGNTPTVGTGVWSVISGSATITTPSFAMSDITGLVVGTSAVLRWTITNGTCYSTDEVIITINALPTYSIEVISGMDSICGIPGTSEIVLNVTGTLPCTFSLSNGQQSYGFTQTEASHVYQIEINKPLTEYWISLLTDANNCSADTSGNLVTIYGFQPVIADAQTPVEICGNTATLQATPVTIGTNWWTAPLGITFLTSPEITNAQISASQYITYQIIWNVKNGACTDSESVYITFYHEPLQPDAGIDITLIDQASVQLNATTPQYGIGIWSIVSGNGTFNNLNEPQTTVSNFQEGENIFRWTVVNGTCFSLFDDVKIIFTNLFIPEGFSPNSDGLNDYFEITGIEFYPKSEFIVFNRWGIEVYNKIGYDNTWDGKSMNNKVLPEDTYFYILKLDGKNSRKGYIILKR
ncbi:MAG: hypothetical protein COZ21_03420, partial [Bacteroidetes bacterium CG_4_10_14_3_um_filter_31_20]